MIPRVFNKLPASSRSYKAWNPGTIGLSVAAHVVLIGAVLVATRETEEPAPPPPKPEEVTYVDVSQIPPPPEPEPEPVIETPEPRVTPPSAAPRQPRVRPVAPPKANEVAGTQELRNPPIVTGIPDPDVAAPPVKREDFGGRGALGGTAAGTPPPPAPPVTSGSGTGSGTSGTAPEGGGTYSAKMVDRVAELLNREHVARRLTQLYPRLLSESGVTGTVSVQFVVTPEGRVEMSSVKILSSSHEAFSDATMKILRDLRFRPARVGDTNVRMLTVMPVKWNLEH